MNRLRHARTSRGWMLQDAARRLETNAGNLSRIEQGKQSPSIALARRIAALYEMSLDDVFDDTEPARASAA